MKVRVPAQALAIRAIAPAILLSLTLGACADSATSPDEAAQSALAADAIEVWWPTEGAWLSGTHVFKGLLPGWDLKDYRLYWRVDGGQLNKMSDSYEGGAHKRATVGLDSWTWRGTGPYVVTFVATDKRGRTTLAQRSVTIYVGAAPPATLEVLQPGDGEWLSGTVSFSARIVERSASGYVMHWQVDGGQLNPMADAADGSGDVAQVDVSTWTWRGTGPYIVDFVAMDGDVRLAEKRMSVYVGAPPAAVAAVEVTPATLGIEAGATAQLQAVTRDAAGNTLTGRTVTWTTSDAALATVDVNGLVTGAAAGIAVVTATSEGMSGSAVVTVTAPPPPPPPSTENPFGGISYYVDPYSNARKTADQWASTRPSDAIQMEKIAAQPQADWFGEWSGDIRSAVSNRVGTITAAGALPVLIAYMIPGRDCNGYSAGGSSTADAYRSWIGAFAEGIGTRRAVVVLEPDALPALDCLPSADQQSRMELLAYAAQTLKAQGNTAVYIDAGHARWKSADVMAARLQQAGIAYADGFSLNVSNFVGNADSKTYGETVSSLLGGGVHFIIDSSRNGLGSNGEWCNPSGRALGSNPTAATGHALLDAYYWLKRPGESDGTCNGGPSAGSWWADYALGLAERQTTDMSTASVRVADAR